MCPVRATRDQRQNLGASEAAGQKLLERRVPTEIAGRFNLEGDLAGALGCSMKTGRKKLKCSFDFLTPFGQPLVVGAAC